MLASPYWLVALAALVLPDRSGNGGTLTALLAVVKHLDA